MILTQAVPPRTESEVLFADVIVPRHLTGPFTYTVPSSLHSTLRIGHRVIVPFGRSLLQGAVIALSHILPHGLDRTRLKEICSLVGESAPIDVSSNLFQLSRKVAEQYVAPWGQCLRLVLPPPSKPRTPVNHYELTELGQAALVARELRSAKARALLTRLGKKPLRRRQSSHGLGSEDLLRDFMTRGWVVEVQSPPSSSKAHLARSTIQSNQDNFDAIPSLIPDPAMSWSEPLFKALRSQGPSRVLVQASFWTDRLRLLHQTVRLVLDRGQTVLIIVGEAERAEWLAGLIHDKTGISPVCFHSDLSDQMKGEIWDQIHRQIVRVVVGTRSAIFLPLTAIGVIWVEGEEDPAFKELQEPRYHAREVAWLRAQDERAVLVLSSPHPCLETRTAVEQCGGIAVRKLMSSDARPNVQIVELRDHGRGTVLSQPLVRAIEHTISRGAGVLLFLNRKGYAGALLCRDCGQVSRCSTCRVALVYFRQTSRLLCSYCGNVAPIPETCVSCSSPRIQLIGEGTERVEEDVKRLFPHTAVIRLDGDTMRRRTQAEALWRRIERGEWNIIVGTQLLLRRRPLPAMGLVGIVRADTGLSVPDFRSAERTYHTLLDAVSLASPAEAGGQVIVQTYLSSHHAIQAVAHNDESLFLSEELSHRIALGYPPAVYLIALMISGPDEKMALDAATAWATRLAAFASSAVGEPAASKASSMAQSISRPDCLNILGPVPSPMPRVRRRSRWQILLKSSEREAGLEAVRITVKDMERTYQRRSIKFDVDVDPIEMF
jgi:primosomal protein N' (replication factor Y) (superfamily II helicase)